ncbi:MAG: deoA, partial [Devosia sp.]|nr:deoA [Devosia sp.]
TMPADSIDHSVGFDRLAGLGDRADGHTPIARLHARTEDAAAAAEARLKAAYRLGDTPARHDLIPARLAPLE